MKLDSKLTLSGHTITGTYLVIGTYRNYTIVMDEQTLETFIII